jgi:hypothetical protein
VVTALACTETGQAGDAFVDAAGCGGEGVRFPTLVLGHAGHAVGEVLMHSAADEFTGPVGGLDADGLAERAALPGVQGATGQVGQFLACQLAEQHPGHFQAHPDETPDQTGDRRGLGQAGVPFLPPAPALGHLGNLGDRVQAELQHLTGRDRDQQLAPHRPQELLTEDLQRGDPGRGRPERPRHHRQQIEDLRRQNDHLLDHDDLHVLGLQRHLVQIRTQLLKPRGQLLQGQVPLASHHRHRRGKGLLRIPDQSARLRDILRRPGHLRRQLHQLIAGSQPQFRQIMDHVLVHHRPAIAGQHVEHLRRPRRNLKTHNPPPTTSSRTYPCEITPGRADDTYSPDWPPPLVPSESWIH